MLLINNITELCHISGFRGTESVPKVMTINLTLPFYLKSFAKEFVKKLKIRNYFLLFNPWAADKNNWACFIKKYLISFTTPQGKILI